MTARTRGSGVQPELTADLPRGGGRVRLRPWTTADVPALLLCFTDPAIRHYAGRLIDDRTAASGAVAQWQDDWSAGHGAAWALTTPGDQIAGGVRFLVLDPDLASASVGYWLLPEGRGRGIASAALREATAVAFARLGWHRIEVYHAVENERSCAVARRAGYRYEGTLREGMRYPVDGRWSDEHLHARLRTDRA